MSITVVSINGIEALVNFDYQPETLFNSASVELHSVQSQGVELVVSSEWQKKAQAEILSVHGPRLQRQAEEAAFERATNACE